MVMESFIPKANENETTESIAPTDRNRINHSKTKKFLSIILLLLILAISYFNFLKTFTDKVDEEYINSFVQKILNHTVGH